MNENCTLTADNYGSYSVKVLTISYGTKITGENQYARSLQTFLVSRVLDDNFSLGMVFKGYDEFAAFGAWMKGYVDLQSGPDSQAQPMSVMIPVRNFSKIGIPISDIPFGDAYNAITYKVGMTFVTTINPQASDFSQFIPAPNDTIFAPYFYPSGQQLNGNDGPGVDFYYDNPSYFSDEFTPTGPIDGPIPLHPPSP